MARNGTFFVTSVVRPHIEGPSPWGDPMDPLLDTQLKSASTGQDAEALWDAYKAIWASGQSRPVAPRDAWMLDWRALREATQLAESSGPVRTALSGVACDWLANHQIKGSPD